MGSDSIKSLLNKKGFAVFLEHLRGEFGADKLITELYTDNRTLCGQVTAMQIKQFVNLILSMRGMNPATVKDIKEQVKVFKAIVNESSQQVFNVQHRDQ